MNLIKKEETPVEIDMSPMIDMVFLLLIFFIVASAVVKVDPVKIEIPKAVYAKVPDDETGRFKITVNPAGEFFVGPQQDQVDEEGLKEAVAAELELDNEVKILIRSDMQVKYEYNEKILMACAEVGAMDMIFSAFESMESAAGGE